LARQETNNQSIASITQFSQCVRVDLNKKRRFRMSRSYPSLIALRVFEVAGRLHSFSSAAIELNVTQGAVSRQVRALEDELDVKLFTRLTRRVQLTDAGRIYLAEVQAGLEQIKQATVRVRARETHAILTINVLPSVGSFWLMPRLAEFTQRYPDIETRIISSIGPADLHSRDVDVAIRVGALPGRRYDPLMPRVDLAMAGDWRGVLAEELAPDVLVPVYSPTLVPDGTRPQDPKSICNLPLIHTASRTNAWPDWIRAQGLSESDAPRVIEYGHFFMSLEAARKGQGVALVPDILLSDSNSHNLIIASTSKVRSAGEYYLLSLNDRCQERAISLFRQWMQEQIRSTSAVRISD
jgi:LysR family glycine cleavage system transcriptional activator